MLPFFKSTIIKISNICNISKNRFSTLFFDTASGLALSDTDQDAVADKGTCPDVLCRGAVSDWKNVRDNRSGDFVEHLLQGGQEWVDNVVDSHKVAHLPFFNLKTSQYLRFNLSLIVYKRPKGNSGATVSVVTLYLCPGYLFPGIGIT